MSEKATFAAGCFWGVESAFRQVPGVLDAAVGYSGGTFPDPTYEDVCTGRTGHAESLQVEFDPARVSYDQLLDVFWENHDPTTLNRQGPDVGTQYRSAIFYTDTTQQKIAKAYIAQMGAAHTYGNAPIVTTVQPLSKFWPAEGYHQDFAYTPHTNDDVVTALLMLDAMTRNLEWFDRYVLGRALTRGRRVRAGGVRAPARCPAW